jgi:hypothetical protein
LERVAQQSVASGVGFQPDEEDDEAYDITSVCRLYQCEECFLTSEHDFFTRLVMVVDPTQPPIPVSERYRSSHIKPNWQARLHAGDDLMIVAIQDSDIHWMEPRDLSPAELISRITNPSQQANHCLQAVRSIVIKQDDTVQFLNEQETLQRLQKMRRDNP